MGSGASHAAPLAHDRIAAFDEARRLGAFLSVHSRIGALKQRLQGGAVRSKSSDSEAESCAVTQHKRRIGESIECPTDGLLNGCLLLAGEQNLKFIATRSADDSARGDSRREAVDERLEHLVAEGVSVKVVDLLEVVEVNHGEN